MKRKILIIGIVFVMVAAVSVFAGSYGGKKILFIDSYHGGYEWSDGIVEGIQNVLKGTGVDLKIVRMDTKRNTAESFKQQAAQKVKQEIETYKPDVVIAADDNASKYVIMPFYKDAKIPVVFCGLNWDATIYGYPYKNATGMVEVALVKQLIDNMKVYAKGSRIGFISTDNETERKEGENYKKIFKLTLNPEKYVKTFAEWKEAYKNMQNQVDILLVINNAGISGWNDAEAEAWVQQNTKVITGSIYDFMSPFAMITLAKVSQEQGIWSAQTALKILDGTSPSKVPIVQNKQGKTYLNVKIASKAGVVFKPELMKNATVLK